MSFGEQPDAPLHGECAAEIARLERQRDELAAQVEVMRDAILQFRNEPMLEFAHAIRATSGYAAMEFAALPNTTAAILRQRDARVLREAAEICAGMFEGQVGGVHVASMRCAEALNKKADELERK